MKFPLVFVSILLLSNLCFAQVDPLDVISNKEFHENALKVEKERNQNQLNLESLIQKLNSPEPKVVIDLRGAHSFKSKHLKGSVNVPMEELTEVRLKEIAPDKKTPIIIYCDNSFFPTRSIGLTTYGYPTLRKFGYENVFEIEPLWRKSMDAPKELETYWEVNK